MKYPIHQGQTVKRIIQIKGYSITEFAKLANVNRRFIFMWFDRPELEPGIIQAISKVIDYDFGADFSAPKLQSAV